VRRLTGSALLLACALAAGTSTGAAAQSVTENVGPPAIEVGTVVDRNYPIPLTSLAANLNATVTPGGFSSPAVPRNLNNSSINNAPLTPTLDGNVFNTWLNWAVQHEGPGNIPEVWESRVDLDEVPTGSGLVGPNSAPSSYQAVNVGPVVVRGGRHSLTIQADAANAVAETNEADNTWRGQWVWSPFTLTRETPLVRSAPPVPNGTFFSDPNSDGFSFVRPANYAWVVSEAPTTVGDDYDLYCYSDYSGSSSGFSVDIGLSNAGGNFTDFVVGHFQNTPITIYHGVVRFSITGASTYAQDQSDAQFRNGSGSFALFSNQTLAADRLADVYEGLFTSGAQYTLLLERTAGSAILGAELYPGTAGGIYGRGDGAAFAPITPTQSILTFTATSDAWHPIVVYRDRGTDRTPVSYTLRWGDVVGVADEDERLALDFQGARPNPVDERTSFEFSLSSAGRARLELYDLNGRRVRSLIEAELLAAGKHAIPWDGRGDRGDRVGAGVYWARLEAEGRSITKRLVMLK
jgi:hypothetical protein